jgi:hypothetical protein
MRIRSGESAKIGTTAHASTGDKELNRSIRTIEFREVMDNRTEGCE